MVGQFIFLVIIFIKISKSKVGVVIDRSCRLVHLVNQQWWISSINAFIWPQEILSEFQLVSKNKDPHLSKHESSHLVLNLLLEFFICYLNAFYFIFLLLHLIGLYHPSNHSFPTKTLKNHTFIFSINPCFYQQKIFKIAQTQSSNKTQPKNSSKSQKLKSPKLKNLAWQAHAPWHDRQPRNLSRDFARWPPTLKGTAVPSHFQLVPL